MTPKSTAAYLDRVLLNLTNQAVDLLNDIALDTINTLRTRPLDFRNKHPQPALARSDVVWEYEAVWSASVKSTDRKQKPVDVDLLIQADDPDHVELLIMVARPGMSHTGCIERLRKAREHQLYQNNLRYYCIASNDDDFRGIVERQGMIFIHLQEEQ